MSCLYLKLMQHHNFYFSETLIAAIFDFVYISNLEGAWLSHVNNVTTQNLNNGIWWICTSIWIALLACFTLYNNMAISSYYLNPIRTSHWLYRLSVCNLLYFIQSSMENKIIANSSNQRQFPATRKKCSNHLEITSGPIVENCFWSSSW